MKPKPRRRISCENDRDSTKLAHLEEAASQKSEHDKADFLVTSEGSTDDGCSTTNDPPSNKRKSRTEVIGRRPAKRGKVAAKKPSEPKNTTADDFLKSQPKDSNSDSIEGEPLDSVKSSSIRRRHTTSSAEPSVTVKTRRRLCRKSAKTSRSMPPARRFLETTEASSSIDEDVMGHFCSQHLNVFERRVLRFGKLRSNYTDTSMEMMKRRARHCAASMSNDYSNLPITINPRTRCVVTQWMVYVQRKLPSPLNPFSLHVAISIFDRFISSLSKDQSTTKVRDRKQLRKDAGNELENIGASCLFIASKLEDVWPVDVKDLCALSNGEVTEKAVLRWELNILKELDFEVNVPTVLDFLYLLLQSTCPSSESPTKSECGKEAEKEKEDPEYLIATKLLNEKFKLDQLLHPTEWKPKYEHGKGKSLLEACAEYIGEVALMHHLSVGVYTYHLAAACIFAAITYISKIPRRTSNVPDSITDTVCAEDERDVFKAAIGNVCTIIDEHFKSSPGDEAVLIEDKGGPGRLHNFASDVDAKHKDACMYFLDAYGKWKSMYQSEDGEAGVEDDGITV
eukprot:GHVO01028151.1.p1 GENE.GHVO01028151.1~~GHVO01028151.1.p1  ORF type:complete len:567 (+),score=79.55 GHVO01028151.1:73-1773(+)